MKTSIEDDTLSYESEKNSIERSKRLDSLKKDNIEKLDEFNIMILDNMAIHFIDRYLRKRKLTEINKIK